MASASSINSSANTMSHHDNHHHAPNPPPRNQSRPNQPPPPPPLPSVPPVPPTRDSSIALAKNDGSSNFLSPFVALFKPLGELPAPEPFMNKPKTYPSQRAQQKQQTN